MGRSTWLLVVGALVLGACSGSAEFSIGDQSLDEAAKEVISGELAEQLGFGEITPTCDPVDDPAVGSSFTCTGTTADGRIVDYEAVVDREDHINVETTNVVNTDLVEPVLLDSLNGQNPDAGLTAEGVDCGEGFVILDDAGQMPCQISPANATPQTATLTFEETQSGNFQITFDS